MHTIGWSGVREGVHRTLLQAVSNVNAAGVCPLLQRAVQTVGPECRDESLLTITT